MNVQHATEFLRWLGHTNLLAATPNWDDHFAPPQDADIAQWIADQNSSGHNIYFSVNPTRAVGKGTKADVIEARYVHCDVDDPARIEESAALAKQHEVACVFRSGRGIGILVRLTEPTKDFDAVELINRKLIVGYGGDRGTHNVDRILKLPGTTAWMSDKKKLAGAVDAETFVEYYDQKNGYASVDQMLEMLKNVPVTERVQVQRITNAVATDEQIIFKLRSESQWEASLAGDHSAQLARMLRCATKLSTNEAQVREIIEQSPYAQIGPGTSDGKSTRLEKIQRVWSDEWPKALMDTEEHRANAKKAARTAQIARDAKIATPDELEEINADIPRAANPSIYVRPIGLLGDMFDYFMEHSVAPNPVFALAGAKTMLAGIIGRQYQVNGGGIQLYNLVLAQSGSGKQSATSGIRSLEHALMKVIPQLWNRHSGPTMLASAPGMQTLLAEKPSCYAVLNEYAHTLDAMTIRSSNENTKRLKGALLDLYTASAPGTIFGAAWYSDKEKKKDPVVSPAFSFLGDAVAEDFKEILTADSIKDGYIPRHSIYVYDQGLPKANRSRRLTPPPQLVDVLSKIITHIAMLQAENKFVTIPIYGENVAADLYDKYSTGMAEQLGNHDPVLPLYRRSAHKILQEAALAAWSRWAAGQGPLMISETDIDLAEAFVYHQTQYMVDVLRSGGLGRGGNAREAKIMEIVASWAGSSKKQRLNYRAPKFAVGQHTYVPARYIVQRAKHLTLFQQDSHRSPADLIRITLESMVRQGMLDELTAEQKINAFGLESDTSSALYALPID